MSLIVNLPQDLINSLFREWVSPLTLVYLDSASCQSQLRPSLMSSLSVMPPIYISDVEFKKMNRACFLNWTFVRDVHLSRVFINYSLFSFGTFHCRFHPLTIVEMTIHLKPNLKDTFISTLNLCQNLRSIRYLCNPDMICSLDSAIMANLICINLTCAFEETIQNALVYVKAHCHKLQFLVLDEFEYFKTAPDVVNDIVEQNPQLEFIQIYCNKQCIEAIKKHCKRVKSLILEVTDTSGCIESPISEVFQSCPLISEFSLLGTVGPFTYRIEKELENMSLYANCMAPLDAVLESFCCGWVRHLLGRAPGLHLFYTALPFSRDDGLLLLQHSRHSLQSLHLCDGVYLTPLVFQQVYAQCDRLTSLTLHGLYFSCSELLQVFQQRESCILTELELELQLLEGFTISEVSSILHYCSALVKFFVTGLSPLPPSESIMPLQQTIDQLAKERQRPPTQVKLWFKQVLVSFNDGIY